MISVEAEWIRIGGLTTWTEVIRTPLPRCLDALKAAAREVGSVQIQNGGTAAGNLCNASPAADGIPHCSPWMPRWKWLLPRERGACLWRGSLQEIARRCGGRTKF